MRNVFIVAGLFVLAVAVVLLLPPMKISGEEIIKTAEAAPETVFFKSLYPSASYTAVEVGCIPLFLHNYVEDISAPLAARKVPGCSDKDKDWLVSYSATGVTDTNTLYVGVDDDNGGKLIDSAFISPYDDVYVLNYSFGTLPAVLEKVLGKSGIAVSDGWAVFFVGETKYLIFMMPHGSYTAVQMTVEQTSEHSKPATMENLRSEMSSAHNKFAEGEKKFTELMRDGFLGNWTVTTHYLYYPETK